MVGNDPPTHKESMTRDEIVQLIKKELDPFWDGRSKKSTRIASRINEKLLNAGVLKVDDDKSDEPREFWIAFYKDGSTEVFYEQPSEFRTFPEDLKGISHVREVVTESEPKQPKEPSASQSRVVLDTERIKKEQFDAKLHALSEYLSKIKERESNIDELIKLGIEYFQAKVK